MQIASDRKLAVSKLYIKSLKEILLLSKLIIPDYKMFHIENFISKMMPDVIIQDKDKFYYTGSEEKLIKEVAAYLARKKSLDKINEYGIPTYYVSIKNLIEIAGVEKVSKRKSNSADCVGHISTYLKQRFPEACITYRLLNFFDSINQELIDTVRQQCLKYPDVFKLINLAPRIKAKTKFTKTTHKPIFNIQVVLAPNWQDLNTIIKSLNLNPMYACEVGKHIKAFYPEIQTKPKSSKSKRSKQYDANNSKLKTIIIDYFNKN